MVAPLQNRLLMIPREVPSYLSTARSIRYPHPLTIQRPWEVICQLIHLIKEILSHRPNFSSILKNKNKLIEEFKDLHKKLPSGTRPICSYFVASHDYNGGILGDFVYYYHHYKIRKLQQHYDVSAKVIESASQIFTHLHELKTQYPKREIQLVDIVAHGDCNAICIKPQYSTPVVQEEEFSACAKNATIILDSCLTGKGENSIAETIARKNPGKTVFAPTKPLYFSKPIFKIINGSPKVTTVVHGYAIFNAFTSRKFKFPA